MLIGIVGAPNKGKSTLFSALTLNEVAIADYPFTTIDPNLGVAYATKDCVHRQLGVQCGAKNPLCVNGTRLFPVNVIDVAGLVEGASEGKGMGSQFLNDLVPANVLLLVVDASGKTDSNGNPADGSDPSGDAEMILNELSKWLSGVIMKNMQSFSRSSDGLSALCSTLSGLSISRDQVESAAGALSLNTSKINWNAGEAGRFALELVKKSKPMLIVANKSDTAGAQSRIEKLSAKFGADHVVGCSAAVELALRKAARSGIIGYMPGGRTFELLKGDVAADQLKALDYMKAFASKNGTNVQEAVNRAIFGIMECITVYPVEDETKYTNHFGEVLPDALLVKKGSTALELAAHIHTDIAKGMLYGINARTKMRIGKDYVLQDNDVIKIVSAAK